MQNILVYNRKNIIVYFIGFFFCQAVFTQISQKSPNFIVIFCELFLDKDFVKDLSAKLLEWTDQRWIISFSKNQGGMSIKDKEKNKQKELIEKAKKSDLYKAMLNSFPDADLIDVKFLNKENK